MIDLHMHSTASDGTDTPSQLIEECAAKELALCSITDHDNVDAQEEAVAAAARLGVPYITGVELSVQYTGELHILGYGYDHQDAAWRRSMEELRAFRIERTLEFIRRLQTEGVGITLQDVERAAMGNTLGRPHVAQAIVAKGYAKDFHEAYIKYLVEGALCYVNRRRLDARTAIDMIRSAGGTPVLAHPGLVTSDDFPALLRSLADDGLEGMEVYYPMHSDAQLEEFLSLAEDLNLLVTCGCDCHGSIRKARIGEEHRTGERLRQSAAVLAERYATRSQTV